MNFNTEKIYEKLQPVSILVKPRTEGKDTLRGDLFEFTSAYSVFTGTRKEHLERRTKLTFYVEYISL